MQERTVLVKSRSFITELSQSPCKQKKRMSSKSRAHIPTEKGTTLEFEDTRQGLSTRNKRKEKTQTSC